MSYDNHCSRCCDVSEETGRIVQIMPADGWLEEYEEPDGSITVEPLVGWGLKADGSVVPLNFIDHQSGAVEVEDHVRVFHPSRKRRKVAP